MASRLDKIQKLTAGLATLADPDPALAPQPPAPHSTPVPVPGDGPRRGRPPVETVPMNLRMPTALRDRVTVEAGRRSQAARRTITPQAVILELMDRHLPELPDADPSDPGGNPARG